MKTDYAIAVSLYITICLIVLALPVSAGYDHVVWKLLVAQIYAVPVAAGWIVTRRALRFRYAAGPADAPTEKTHE